MCLTPRLPRLIPAVQWRAAAEAAIAVIPDISVAVADTGEGAVLPGWVDKLADIVPLPYLVSVTASTTPRSRE